MSRSTCFALLAAAVTLSSSLSAQEVGPQAGTWGAEAGADNRVNVLRFRSTTSAWMFGFSANYQKREIEDTELTIQSHELRLGIRSYSNPESRTRPIKGISAIIGYEDVTANSSGLLFGGALELGAVHFFSRHVSLGGAIDLSATYTSGEMDDFPTGATVDVSSIAARAGFRMLAAVYF